MAPEVQCSIMASLMLLSYKCGVYGQLVCHRLLRTFYNFGDCHR